MKNLLHNLLFIGLIVSADCIAQPTLTASGINPVIGDQINTTNTNYVSPGNSGANQTWNLSSMTATGTTSNTAVSVSSTPSGSSFPNATVAFNGGSSYSYYNTSSTAFQFYGIASSVVISYSNPEDFLQFPFSFSNSYTDTWSATFVNTYTYYRTGTTNVTADSYGTLITPDGTFNNVLRIHFVQNYQDSTYIPSVGPYVITYTNDQYMWYLNGNHFPIASVYSFTSTTTTQGGYYMNGVLGIKESATLNSLNVFPNPASENMNIHFNLSSNQKVEIKLYNSEGSLIEIPVSANGTTGNNEYTLCVNDLPAGIYFAEIVLNGILESTRRFTVSK